MLRVLVSGGQGCVRKGGRGGGSEREGGGGGGWDTPPPRVPRWSPPKAGRKVLNSNPLGTEGAEAKFWQSASNVGRGGVGGGEVRGRGVG